MAQIIPASKLFRDFSSLDELWSSRKLYFFKPQQSFGSKGVYSGKGISRKAFERLDPDGFMAQELCPPGRQTFIWDDQEVELKYDLRFYSFQGEIQHSVARLYQGQATNMKTPLGGLAPIIWQ